MKKVFLAICLMASSSLCVAGVQTGTISYVIVRASDGLIYFAINNGAKTGSPVCATQTYWMIGDELSNAGKQQYAMILAAFAAGKTVSITGMGTCTRWGDGEDVNSIQVY